ncbi:hypothetical protein RFI_30029, partial [Reticulomyxa filosa]
SANKKEPMNQDPIKRRVLLSQHMSIYYYYTYIFFFLMEIDYFFFCTSCVFAMCTAPDNITTNEVVLDYFNLSEITGGQLLDIFSTKKGNVIGFNSFIIGLARTKQYNKEIAGEVDTLIEIHRQESTSKIVWCAGCCYIAKDDVVFDGMPMVSANQISVSSKKKKFILTYYLKNDDLDMTQSVEQLAEDDTDNSSKETCQNKVFMIWVTRNPDTMKMLGMDFLQTNMG